MRSTHLREKTNMTDAARLVGAACCIALTASPVLWAGVVPAKDAPIVTVTVFPDRAEVVREAKVSLPPGASTIEFTGLPWQAERDSFRASARGVAATLGAVEIRADAREPVETPELIAARAEVQRLEEAISLIDADEATAAELREFLKSLQATTAARESERLGQGQADPASIQAVFDLVQKGLAGLSRSSQENRARRAPLFEELKVARAKLAAARPAGPIRTLAASVDVETQAAGSLTVRLEYLSPGASWNPAYRASLDATTGEIALASEAVVRQGTGEDWKGVELRLSTASPSRGVEPPEMPPLLLRPIEIMAMEGLADVSMMKQARVADAPAAPKTAADEVGGAGLMNAVEEVEAERREAGIVRSGYNLAFEVPGRTDLLADGSEHRVGLRQETLPGSVDYRAVPALNAAAFMVAHTKAAEAYPLLAGAVRVFAGSAYLGSFPLSETGPGGELTFPFGVDNRVSVERTPKPQDRGRSGIFGRERRIAYGFRTVIENLRDKKVSLVLEDRVPVSEDERIKVEMGEGTTSGWKEIESRPGILEWSLELAAKEKREVVLEYEVRFPKDLIVPGAE